MSTPDFDFSGLVTLGGDTGEVCGPDGCFPGTESAESVESAAVEAVESRDAEDPEDAD